MLSQILALIIAIVLFSALLQGKYPRYLLTLAAGGAMVLVVLLGTMGSPAAALEALSVDSFVKPQFWFAHGGVTEFNVGINWSTILFLAGMMIMVEAMSEAGFFDWVCLRLAKALGFRPMPLMLSFMVLAALLSMFVDSITVVLFLVVATARLAHFLRFDPVPMIIGEIRRFLRDNNALRVSRSLRDTAYRAMQSREALEKQLGREPTMDEIAQAAGLARREVTAALESVVEPISLEEPVYTDGGDAMYVIDQVRDPDGEDSWISGLQFRQTVAGLTPREKRIMELRYLQGKTQMEVAREIGISQAQVSRLEKGALSQFRTRD